MSTADDRLAAHRAAVGGDLSHWRASYASVTSLWRAAAEDGRIDSEHADYGDALRRADELNTAEQYAAINRPEPK